MESHEPINLDEERRALDHEVRQLRSQIETLQTSQAWQACEQIQNKIGEQGFFSNMFLTCQTPRGERTMKRLADLPLMEHAAYIPGFGGPSSSITLEYNPISQTDEHGNTYLSAWNFIRILPNSDGGTRISRGKVICHTDGERTEASRDSIQVEPEEHLSFSTRRAIAELYSKEPAIR